MEEEIRKELYQKLEEEFKNYIEEIKQATPEEIVNSSYQIAMKEELVAMFFPEGSSYDINDIKALNKCDKPLEELYQGWMDCDGGIHEVLQYSVDNTIEDIKKEQLKDKNKDRER